MTSFPGGLKKKTLQKTSKNCPIRLELDRLRKFFPVLWVKDIRWSVSGWRDAVCLFNIFILCQRFSHRWCALIHPSPLNTLSGIPDFLSVSGYLSLCDSRRNVLKYFLFSDVWKLRSYLQNYSLTSRGPVQLKLEFCFRWSLSARVVSFGLFSWTDSQQTRAIFTFMRNTLGFIIGLFFGWPVFSASVCFLWWDRRPRFHWHFKSWAFLSLFHVLPSFSSSFRIFMTFW